MLFRILWDIIFKPSVVVFDCDSKIWKHTTLCSQKGKNTVIRSSVRPSVHVSVYPSRSVSVRSSVSGCWWRTFSQQPSDRTRKNNQQQNYNKIMRIICSTVQVNSFNWLRALSFDLCYRYTRYFLPMVVSVYFSAISNYTLLRKLLLWRLNRIKNLFPVDRYLHVAVDRYCCTTISANIYQCIDFIQEIIYRRTGKLMLDCLTYKLLAQSYCLLYFLKLFNQVKP